jgi:hypothetical protein
MRCFFDKRATVVDVTDKEIIDLFQDGLYHRRTFEDFGRLRPSSITKLKDMITSWAGEEDKANAKYDAIPGKSKQNAGGNNNNRDQGGRNKNYSGPNRKHKPDNTVAVIQRPAKDNSKKTSGGVPRNLIEHSLNVDPKATPKRQHLRRFADDQRDAIKKELSKLLAVGFIREVFHHKWLANPILIRKKKCNEWRMSVDYANLNKHCPKDPFGLPRIDQVIDSTSGCDLLCFLDYYFGYH